MWWCRGLRFRIPIDEAVIKHLQPTQTFEGDLPGTHFRNWVSPQTFIKEKTVVIDTKTGQPLTVDARNQLKTGMPNTFDPFYEISSRFDWFSGGWTALTVALMTCVVVFFVTLSTAANEVYGVSPTDKFAPSPKKFKDRVFCFGIFTAVILGLLSGIIVAHIKTTPRGNFFFGMMVLLGAAGAAGFIAALTTPQTDDSDMRVFYTERGLAKVSGSSGYVIRCLFMSVCLFLLVAVVIYFLTSYCLDNKFISNLDNPSAKGLTHNTAFFGAGPKKVGFVQAAAHQGSGVNTAPQGSGVNNGSLPCPQIHQIRHGFLTYSTLRFVKDNSTQQDRGQKTPPSEGGGLPGVQAVAGAVPRLFTGGGSPQVRVALAGAGLAAAVAGTTSKAQPVKEKFIMDPGSCNIGNASIKEEVLSKDQYLIQTLDLIIPIILVVIGVFIFRIINIMSALSHIMNNIENKEKKAAFDRSYTVLVFFFWVILGIIAVLLIMWVSSYACWASLMIEYNDWTKNTAVWAAQQQQAAVITTQQQGKKDQSPTAGSPSGSSQQGTSPIPQSP